MYNRNKPVTPCQRFAWCMTLCCRCCNAFVCPPCPPCIIGKVAFSPPKPTYSFVPFGPPANADYRIRIRRDAKTLTSAAFPDLVQYDSLFRRFFIPKPACKRKHIACVYARSVLLGTNARNTILLSHTNGEDLGLMISRIALLCQRVSVDVVAYDYFGYGRSSGSCSEKNLYKDIECVYEFMVEKMMIPAKRIIAIGSSLGSVGTVHLASRQVLQGVDPTRRLRIRFANVMSRPKTYQLHGQIRQHRQDRRHVLSDLVRTRRERQAIPSRQSSDIPCRVSGSR